MSLNWKEIDLILEELDLPGVHIQQIRQPDYSSLILGLYRPGDPFELFISLAGGKTRLHRLSQKPANPKIPPRFAEFLRSRIRGGKIMEASQIGRERIVRLSVLRSEETTILWVRLWSGAANIVATDGEGLVLEAFYRRPSRGEIAGGFYDPAKDLERVGTGTRAPREFEIRDLPGPGSFNEKIEACYGGDEEQENRGRLHQRALQSIDQRMMRTESLLEKLRLKLEDYRRLEQYRETGDLLLSNLHAVQKGDRWVTVEDFYHDGVEKEIELDPELGPRENAESYFRKYRKARDGLAILEEDIRNHERLLGELEAQKSRIEGEDDTTVLEGFVAETAGAAKQEEKDRTPGLTFGSSGFRLLVGRTARENDALLRRHVRGNDVWLHARDYPGAYVFIKVKPGKSVPLDVLLDAGNLALFYSKGRNSGQGNLYYTHVKYLRRAKDGKTGLVLPTQEKNLFIRLEPGRLEKLQNSGRSG